MCVNSPGSYVSLQEIKLQTHHSSDPSVASFPLYECVLVLHCVFCQLQGSQWVHEGSCCTAVHLANFCTTWISLFVFKICLPIVFMKGFTPASCLHLETGYLPDSRPIRFAIEVSTDMTDMTILQPITASCHCQHTSLQFSRKTPIARIVYTQQPCQSQETAMTC